MNNYAIPFAILIYGVVRNWRIPFLFYFGIAAKTKEEMVKVRKTLSNYLAPAL